MNHRRADGGIFGWKYRLNCEEGVWRWASPIHQKQHTPWELVHSGRTVCRGSGLITVELSRWVCRPARPSAARRPFAGSGRGSSSHYAQSKPGCELRKDLKVRLLFASSFFFFHCRIAVSISYWVHGCTTARFTQTQTSAELNVWGGGG